MTQFFKDLKDSPDTETDSFICRAKELFLVLEITGLNDDDAFLSGKYYQDYLREGEKLASLRQE